MRNYRIDIDKIVNQLVPHYLGGRRFILFLQALLKPLDTINKSWVIWANEQRRKAAMTSQVILLENYLNRNFGKYLLDPTQRILITEKVAPGTLIYWEKYATPVDHLILYQESEKSQLNPNLKWKDERVEADQFSFTISCPSIDTHLISQKEMTAMIIYQIKQYCIAGKNFEITYNENNK